MGVVTAVVGVTNVLPYLQVESVQADYALSKRPACTFSLVVRAGTSYRPTVGQLVRIQDDSVDVFFGTVYEVEEAPVVDFQHNHFHVKAVGLEYYASVVPINNIIPAGTLKSQVQYLAAYIVSHGVGFDSGMATGPTNPAIAAPWKSIAEGLDLVMAAAGAEWAWSVNTNGQLTAAENAVTAAPFALTSTNSRIRALRTKQTKAGYANSVWIVYGEGQEPATQSWTGDGVLTTFSLNYTPVGIPATVVENGATLPVGLVGGDTAPVWNYNATLNRLERTGGALPNGQVLTWTGTAQFPAALYVSDSTGIGLYAEHSVVLQHPTIYDYDAALAIGTGELARRTGIVRQLTADTFFAGLLPGQAVTVTATAYDLSAVAFLITSLRVRHVLKKPNGQHLFRYSIAGVEGNATRLNWRDYFAAKPTSAGTGASGSIGTGGTGGSPTVTITGAPFRLPLGGTQRRLFTAASSGVWFDAPDGAEWSVTGSQLAGTIFVRVHLRTRGGANATIRARVFDETNTASLGESSDVTADAWTYVGFFVTLPSAEVIIKLQLRVTGSSATTAEVGYWNATLENRL
jgi:hypothetical protein